jgi:hypothetical protein
MVKCIPLVVILCTQDCKGERELAGIIGSIGNRGTERAHQRCVLWRCMFWEDLRMKKMRKMSASLYSRGREDEEGWPAV